MKHKKGLDISSIYASFEKLADQRRARGKRYSLATVLLGLFLAKLCGEDKLSGIAEWVKHREQWITKPGPANRTSGAGILAS